MYIINKNKNNLIADLLLLLYKLQRNMYFIIYELQYKKIIDIIFKNITIKMSIKLDEN